MKDGGEFFKNLLDDQASHDQWKKTAMPQSLPQFSDVLNAWNFRSFIQETRHQTQTKPQRLAVVNSGRCVKWAKDPKGKHHGWQNQLKVEI